MGMIFFLVNTPMGTFNETSLIIKEDLMSLITLTLINLIGLKRMNLKVK